MDLNTLNPSSISLRSFLAEGSRRGGADKARMKLANNSTSSPNLPPVSSGSATPSSTGSPRKVLSFGAEGR